ncbi:hypothetical protein [Nonomuraea jiangxiensis]|uniref:hypothetical protein n=1 Tax=Nonomuraea jiangxiensis TaxID=633440 RepID=UPI000B897D70|nr:hypothetical protein [Nonomuraea jiangxiensis]
MIGVIVVAVVGVLIYRNRVQKELAQTRKQLAEARRGQERLSREGSGRDQRLQQVDRRLKEAERKAKEAERQIQEAERKAMEAERRTQEAERQVAEAAEQVGRARARHDLVREETDHLLTSRIPALVAHLRAPHVIVPGLHNAALAGTDVDKQHRAILDALARSVREEGERIDEAAQAVVRGAMSRVQTQALRAQDLLAGVQRRYSGDEHTALLREVLGLDMFNELIVRRAQASGIACGATTGLSRDDTYLVDLVVGAISRVENFEQRIDGPANHLRRRVGVAARAAEPILFITSELLANAVHHSHGTLKVTIAIHETNTGAAIVIDDAGVGLNEEQYARATRLLSGQHPVRLVDLGNPPRTGWAAIGRQVSHYGMQVTVKKSAYGGVQAVVSVPAGLLVEMPDTSRPSVLAPEPVRSAPTTQAQHRSAEELPVRQPAMGDFPGRQPATAELPVRQPATAESPGWQTADEPYADWDRADWDVDKEHVDGEHAAVGEGVAQPEPVGTGAALPRLPQRRRQPTRPAATPSPDGQARTTPEEAQRRWGDFQTGAEAGRRAAMPSQPHDATEGN